MQVRRWIREAEKQGWLLSKLEKSTVVLSCACKGCPGSMSLPLVNLGPIPEPCQLEHKKGYGRATFENYEAIVNEFRRRRVQLGLDQIDLNNAMGTADGYVNKLESLARVASPPTLTLWAESLGLRLTTEAAPLPPATLKAIEDRQARPYQETQARWKHSTTAPALPLKPTNNNPANK